MVRLTAQGLLNMREECCVEFPTREVAVRAKIAAGILPGAPCAEVWGGRGTGTICAACDQTVQTPAFEYECRTDDGHVFWLCQPCLYAWDAVIRDSNDLIERAG